MTAVFNLRPHSPGEAPLELQISGSVDRLPGTLFITYTLAGDPGGIVLPAPARPVSRRHELWRRTCFEIFFRRPGQAAYWEVNFSPSGDWNVYRFTDYRQGMTEEVRLGETWSREVGRPQRREFRCRLDIHDLCPDAEDLEAAVSSVVLESSGRLSYWAIDHCGEKPDFHDRRSFLLRLAAPALSGENFVVQSP